MNTWTLSYTQYSEWGVPRVLETVKGVKTTKKQSVADELYKKYTDLVGRAEVHIKKEEK